MLYSVRCYSNWMFVICCNVLLDISIDDCKGTG